MKTEKNLTGNTFGPTMEEFFSDKAMTVDSLLSEVKKTLNILKTPWTTLEIPTKFLHLNQFENSPMMKHLFLPFDMVSVLHVISLAWCVVLNLFLHLYKNHGFVQTCEMPNCLHCAHCSSCHKYIQSPNDSPVLF